MNGLLEIKERGGTILFSELLKEIPPDEILADLLPHTLDPKRPIITQRGLEVLRLRLTGLRQQEIAERLGLTLGQVSRASRMMSFLHHVPSYIDIDVPALRRLLKLGQKDITGYTKLSELLQDMPSDEELLNLFVERGNVIRPGGTTPPTNKDLQLLQMRRQDRTYAGIGAEVGMDAGQIQHQIVITIRRLRRDFGIEIDVPELNKRKRRLPRKEQPLV